MTTMANGCRALSLIKGIEFEEGGPILISNMIKVCVHAWLWLACRPWLTCWPYLTAADLSESGLT